MHYRWLILLLGLLPLTPAGAESPQASPAQTPAPKFFPIPRSTATTQSKTPSKTLLRSDRTQMDHGFLRIDRAQTVAVARATTPLTKPLALATNDYARRSSPLLVTNPPNMARESEEIEGNTESYDPVLALFGANGNPTASSFAEAMGARRAGTSLGERGTDMLWPIPTTIKQTLSSGYGMRADPFNGRATFHGGIDIAAPEGTPVLATAQGTVTQVTTDKNYGHYIAIEHADGTISRYGHLSAQQVTVGQTVRAGQVIGKVGSTGRSTGAHLDYRVSKNNRKFDPLAVLTIPSSVALNTSKPSRPSLANRNRNPAMLATSATGVAQHPLPHAPMLIKVR